MDFLIHLIGSFIASVCFGVLTNVPRKELPYSGISGMIAWMFLWATQQFFGQTDIIGSFLGASVMGIASYFMARKRKMPITMYSIPGIFPLVPGILIYRTFKSFFDGDALSGLDTLMHTFVIAFSIAGGLMVVEIMQRMVTIMHNKKKKIKNE